MAFSMALNGTERDEVARQLKDRFGLEDSGAILDEAFASAGR